MGRGSRKGELMRETAAGGKNVRRGPIADGIERQKSIIRENENRK